MDIKCSYNTDRALEEIPGSSQNKEKSYIEEIPGSSQNKEKSYIVEGPQYLSYIWNPQHYK